MSASRSRSTRRGRDAASTSATSTGSRTIPGEALGWARGAAADGRAESIALVGNAAEIEPAWAKAGERFDVVTDQTSAHDALAGYVPSEISLEDARELRQVLPDEYVRRSMRAMADHVRAILAFKAAGAVAFDYGNNLRAQALEAGVADAYDYPGFVPAYVRPLFCEGRGPFRWAALSGDPADIARTDEAILELFPEDAGLHRWITMAQAKVPFQGLPARICWLGYGERSRAGLAFNDLVARGEVSAPIVIGRDHLDAGSVASPNRETEAMADGSDAIADWPLLNALVNTAAGATWVSIHHGGGVGIGYSQHAGMVVVADGTELAAQKLERVLTTDPGWAWLATSTRAIPGRSRWPASAASGSRCSRSVDGSVTRCARAPFRVQSGVVRCGPVAFGAVGTATMSADPLGISSVLEEGCASCPRAPDEPAVAGSFPFPDQS